MNWQKITSLEDLENIKALSSNEKVLIYKHSTRCGISNSVLHELEQAWDGTQVNHLKTYFLDLLQYREVSDAIAETFDVRHQSPQVLILENEKSIFDTSHWNIKFDIIRNTIA